MIKPTNRYLIYQHNKDSVLSTFLSVLGKGEPKATPPPVAVLPASFCLRPPVRRGRWIGDRELPSGVYTNLKVPSFRLARVRFRVSIADGVEQGDGGGVHGSATCGGGRGGGGRGVPLLGVLVASVPFLRSFFWHQRRWKRLPLLLRL
jgi:hypothetical protein